MAYYVIKPESREAWLEERKKGIGSSDAGTIMGASPFNTPLRLWRQRKGLDQPVSETRAMRFGHAFEPAVADFFAGETGATIDYASEGDWMAVDCDKPYLRVSPDRLFWPEGVEQISDNWRILEIKTTRKAVDKDNIPLYWYCQVQYQMGVMGIKHAVIAYLTSFPSLDADWVEVDFNQAFFNTLIASIDRFWNENIIQGIEPPASDGNDAVIKFPKHLNGKCEEASKDTLSACLDLLKLKKQKKDIETAIAAAESTIKLEAKDSEELVFVNPETGETITAVTYKSVNETVLDEDRLRKEKPEIYEKYVDQVFDRTRFTNENKKTLKDYFCTRSGSRRMTVKPVAKELEEALQKCA